MEVEVERRRGEGNALAKRFRGQLEQGKSIHSRHRGCGRGCDGSWGRGILGDWRAWHWSRAVLAAIM